VPPTFVPASKTRGHAQFAQAVEHIHAGNPGADDDRVVDRELTLALAFRQCAYVWGVCVRHDMFPSLGCAAKIRGGPPAVPSLAASYRFNDHRLG
jgi:hypothetical protein